MGAAYQIYQMKHWHRVWHRFIRFSADSYQIFHYLRLNSRFVENFFCLSNYLEWNRSDYYFFYFGKCLHFNGKTKKTMPSLKENKLQILNVVKGITCSLT